MKKKRLARELTISKNNLRALERDAREIKREWDQKNKLKWHETDVYRRKELARDCSTLGTVYSARDIRVGDEKARIEENKKELSQKQTEINNLISLIRRLFNNLCFFVLQSY